MAKRKPAKRKKVRYSTQPIYRTKKESPEEGEWTESTVTFTTKGGSSTTYKGI